MKRLFLWLFDGLFVKLTDHMGRMGFILYGGGGGGGQTTATQYTSNIPEYASGAFMNLVGKAEALSNTPYQTYTGQRIEGFTPMQQQSFQRAQGLGSTSFTNQGTANAYMSPFMQNVVDIQKREAMRDADIATTQRNAQAVKAGAFGGSRQAIMDAEAARNLQTNLSDIQGRGLQQAFDQAQRQFNTEFGQQAYITGMINQMGGQQQQLGQRQLDQQYADFQAQRDYPYQQLGFLSDILRGVSGSTRTMYSSQPQASGLQMLAGLGTAAAGFGTLFRRGGEVPRWAEGGIVDGYAEGGVVQPQQLTAQLSTLSDTGLQQYTQMHKDDPYTVALAVSEANRRKRLRAAAAGAQDAEPKQGTVIDREIEGMAEPDPLDMGLAAAVPEDAFEMAEGGIVGYADGGDLEEQRMSDREGIAQFGRAIWEQMKRSGAAIADVATLPARGVAGAYDTAVVRPLRAAGLDLGYISPSLVPDGANVDSMTPFYDQFRRRDQQPEYGLGNEGRREPMGPTAAGLAAAAAPTPAPAPQERPAAGGAGVSARGSARGPAAAGLAAAGPDLGLEAAEKQARADIEATTKARRAAAEADAAAFDKDVAERGVLGADREKRIKEQQAGLGDKEERAKSMALVQAGLAILSADPSRGAFAAIGEGALKGVGAYKGDMKDIEATRERLMGDLDKLEDLRRQEAIATGAEKRRLQAEIRKVDVDGEQALGALGQKVGLEVRPKYRMEAWKELQANNRASMAASATLQAAQLRGGDNGPESRAQRDADAAFARDPRVKVLLKQAESPLVGMDPLQQQRITNELRQIQSGIYQQYGLKMTGPAAPAGGATANDPLGIR